MKLLALRAYEAIVVDKELTYFTAAEYDMTWHDTYIKVKHIRSGIATCIPVSNTIFWKFDESITKAPAGSAKKKRKSSSSYSNT